MTLTRLLQGKNKKKSETTVKVRNICAAFLFAASSLAYATPPPASPHPSSGSVKVYDAKGQFLGYPIPPGQAPVNFGGSGSQLSAAMTTFLLPGGEGIFGLQETVQYHKATGVNLGFLEANQPPLIIPENCGSFSGDPSEGTVENCAPYRAYKTANCSDQPTLPANRKNFGSDMNGISYEKGSAYSLRIKHETPRGAFVATKIDSWACPNPSPTSCIGCNPNPWPPVKVEDDVCKAFPFQYGRINARWSDGNGYYYNCDIVSVTADNAFQYFPNGFGTIFEYEAIPIYLPFTIPVSLPLHYEVR